MMTNEQAVEQLHALLKVPGALQIITSERADATIDASRPSAWVIHDVVKIDDPDERGRVRAWSAEGDWCLGYPVDLLPRLQEAGREVAPKEEAEA